MNNHQQPISGLYRGANYQVYQSLNALCQQDVVDRWYEARNNDVPNPGLGLVRVEGTDKQLHAFVALNEEGLH